MKKTAIILGTLAIATIAFAGNPERQGSGGAAQLTINSFARSSAMGWANGSSVSGIESMFMNAAGMDRSSVTTDMSFARTEWLVGSGIGINTAGFTQKLGEDFDKGTIGVSIMQFGIKPIMITTENNPHGGIGTYRVNMTNIGVGYSKSFSRGVSAGIMVRAVSEGIPDASAFGLSLDAGVQYATTIKHVVGGVKSDDFKIGVSLKNIGGDMRHTGQGLTYKAILSDGADDITRTVNGRAEAFKLPALLNICASYDIQLDKDKSVYNNRLTLAAGVTTFAFQADQINLGMEYSYKDFISFRAGYAIQDGSFGSWEERTSAFTGLGAGMSYDVHTNGGKVVSFNYSYRHSNPFSGAHTFGLRFGLGE